MSNLFIEVVQENGTRNYRISDPVLSETKYTDKSTLYKALVKEYGRCISKMYVDVSGRPTQIGWCFARRELYSDYRLNKQIKSLSKEERDEKTFICVTWVSIHTRKPETQVIPHFAKF